MRNRQRGFTLLEMLIVVAIIMVLASITIPNARRSRMVATETATVESLNTLNNACFIYWTEHDGYPPKLADIWPETAASESTDLNASEFSTAIKVGYVFAYRPGSVDSHGKMLSYSVTATPVSPGATGVRSFFTDQSGPIRASETGEATADSPSIN